MGGRASGEPADQEWREPIHSIAKVASRSGYVKKFFD
jgi:hypothetical protein